MAGGHPGNFQPDQELTEVQFAKVVRRLFDAYDSWTRAETAEFLYQGRHGLASPTTTAAAEMGPGLPVVSLLGTRFIQPTIFYLVLAANQRMEVLVRICGEQRAILAAGENEVRVNCPRHITRPGLFYRPRRGHYLPVGG